MMRTLSLAAAALAGLIALPAAAQEDDAPREPLRWRVALGPQITPNYPGSDGFQVSPLVDVSRTRGDRPFDFEAADESFAIPIVKANGFAFGPAINLEGKRKRSEVGADIDEVGFTVEAGGFVQYWFTPGLRAHAEVRQGITGHKGLVSNAGFDVVARDGDKWLFSLGPRVSLSDEKYQDAYFRVTAREAAATGLPQFDPDGFGIHAVGASATGLYQMSTRFGVYGFAKYDRLIEDAGRAPAVRAYGSRNQFSGGLALTYTFGRGVQD
jgi:MipA family protein